MYFNQSHIPDKSKTYLVFWDEEAQCWVCRSEDFQQKGTCIETHLNAEGRDFAPALAVAECFGFDPEIVVEELGMIG